VLQIRIRITIEVQIRILNKAGYASKVKIPKQDLIKVKSWIRISIMKMQILNTDGYSANLSKQDEPPLSWLCSCRPLRSVASSRESSSSYLWTPADPFTTAEERCSPHTTILQHAWFNLRQVPVYGAFKSGFLHNLSIVQ
jgi:hypothetical protein